MLTINTNLSSLVAQSSLKSSTNKLNQAIERMTTGFKINHASDNAAGYSIVTNMNTKIGAYQIAEDNAAMGLDLISTAEGTLDQIQDKLQRLRSLQEQANNGTYGEQSLNAINSEANALVDEIERLYTTAEYNGIKLLCKSSTNIPTKEITIYEEFASGHVLHSFFPTIKPDSDSYLEYKFSDGTVLFHEKMVDIFANPTTTGINIKYGDLVIPTEYKYSEEDGCFYDKNGNAVTLVEVTYDGIYKKTFEKNIDKCGTKKTVNVPDTSVKPQLVPVNIQLQVGINSDSSSQISIDLSFNMDNLSELRNIGKDGKDYLEVADAILKDVSQKQTEYGAVSNRLESVLDEISIQYDNLVSSRSTLRDADIAELSSTYIQQQILQQASATLLATANQSPSVALQLL